MSVGYKPPNTSARGVRSTRQKRALAFSVGFASPILAGEASRMLAWGTFKLAFTSIYAAGQSISTIRAASSSVGQSYAVGSLIGGTLAAVREWSPIVERTGEIIEGAKDILEDVETGYNVASSVWNTVGPGGVVNAARYIDGNASYMWSQYQATRAFIPVYGR
jgi:hypothetical protein